MNGGKCYLSMCYILLRTNFTNCYRKRLIINLEKALTNVKFDTLNKPSGRLFSQILNYTSTILDKIIGTKYINQAKFERNIQL